ncbi:hypothetical protein NXS19_002631 [Fusarium pseudograminearum]|nr:hypothetical protein NXS19_002631 [Fusarium pseudograminearum]
MKCQRALGISRIDPAIACWFGMVVIKADGRCRLTGEAKRGSVLEENEKGPQRFFDIGINSSFENCLTCFETQVKLIYMNVYHSGRPKERVVRMLTRATKVLSRALRAQKHS